MQKPHVFIRFHENGEGREDYIEWVEGVFASLKSAMKHRDGLFLRIDEWKGDEKLGEYNAQGEKLR